MNPEQTQLQELFVTAFARYLSVRPSGLQMPHGPIVSSLHACLLSFRPARTLYQDRKPRCRSLDAIQSLPPQRSCASCPSRKECTPQIFLELLHDRVPYRLLLAYSSARNFMVFLSRLRQQRQPLENTHVLLSVRNRGRWGEVRFIAPPTPQPTAIPLTNT